jgi:hypothetical protein
LHDAQKQRELNPGGASFAANLGVARLLSMAPIAVAELAHHSLDLVAAFGEYCHCGALALNIRCETHKQG